MMTELERQIEEQLARAVLEEAGKIVGAWFPGWVLTRDLQAKIDLVSLVLANLYKARGGRKGTFGLNRSLAVLSLAGVNAPAETAAQLIQFLEELDVMITVEIGRNHDDEYSHQLALEQEAWVEYESLHPGRRGPAPS